MLLLAAAAAAAAAAMVPAAGVRAQIEKHQCHRAVTYGPPNTYTPLDVAAAPQLRKLLAHVRNGKLYEVTVPNTNGTAADGADTSTFTLLHVWGSPYDAGFAAGKLLGARVVDFQTAVWRYLEEQVERGEPTWVPPFLRELIADVGLGAALDLTEIVTKPFTGAHFYEELRGLADATGGDYQRAVRIHMLAGLTQGHCSSFGAWGSATLDGRAISLRALDWNMDGPFRDHPVVSVYHAAGGSSAAPAGARSFASVSFVGFVGGLTGINEDGVSITEIGVSYPDDTFGAQSRIGLPFIFLLRDVLQFDTTRAAAFKRMHEAMRTCDLILGVGDAEQYRAVQYSFSVLNVINWDNLLPRNDTWHFQIADTVYHGMDWLCPGYTEVLGTQLKRNHGELTAPRAIRNVVGVLESGDVHVAVYDNHARDLYVSFAAPHALTGVKAKAYQRRFAKLSASLLWDEQPST